ncbi:MAG: hypothetical protein QOF48_3004 [Verrucomicrobiota bacterium]|jgi:mono/diheme cytochrome c family protein
MLTTPMFPNMVQRSMIISIFTRLPWLTVLVATGTVVVAGVFAQAAFAADARPAAGLVATFQSGDRTDTVAVPGVALYIEAGKPPTPFLAGGKFTVTWEGAVNADLRGQFLFQAELNGSLTVEINGAMILEALRDGGASPLSKAVQLNKGANRFKAIFTSPPGGDAFVRLSWTEKGTNTAPIPAVAFSHATSLALEKSSMLRLGRELFLEHRCIRCHTGAKSLTNALPELQMDAPSLEGIGTRRNYEWLSRWILDPKTMRASARMPKLLHNPTAREDTQGIAAYLASLKGGAETKAGTVAYQTRQAQQKVEGDDAAPALDPKPLYERLNCIGCHNPPDAAQPDPAKMSHRTIPEKFPRGALADYLRAPARDYSWTRMPDFHLSPEEAKELEDYLFKAAPKPELKEAPTDVALVSKGRQLVQTAGCLNCHALKLQNQFHSPDLARLVAPAVNAPSLPARGSCLGDQPVADHGFGAAEKAALQAFLHSDGASLSRDVPADFAERQTRLLNCNACHGQLEGFPPLELLGGKLKPEWMAKFIGGDIPHKMRFDTHPRGMTWLEARMPAFRSRAFPLAAGLAAEQGFPPKSPPESAVNTELAEAGRKIVGKDGGFQCVVCHGVGPLLATDVFESEGINLAWSADRLLPSFFRRWVRSPTSVDPQTKMPVFFEEPKTALTEILDGDSERQISAIWEYIRLREKMPAPKTE